GQCDGFGLEHLSLAGTVPDIDLDGRVGRKRLYPQFLALGVFFHGRRLAGALQFQVLELEQWRDRDDRFAFTPGQFRGRERRQPLQLPNLKWCQRRETQAAAYAGQRRGELERFAPRLACLGLAVLGTLHDDVALPGFQQVDAWVQFQGQFGQRLADDVKPPLGGNLNAQR